MTKLLLATLLLLPLPVSADELQGKAIQCFPNERSDITLENIYPPTMWHIRFLESREVALDQIVLEGQEIKLRKRINERSDYSPFYLLYIDRIIILDVLTLDRRTLVLTNLDSDKEYKCEVFNSHDDYFVAIRETVERLEKQIEVLQSENQI